MSTVIDPTQPAKYPVVLSDALLGGTAKEVFTNIRYNYKPDLTSDTAPDQARLKPSIPGSTSSYELSFQDGDAASGGGKYAYEGTRTPGDGQYVLYFDPARSVFVLDKVDSAFNMNVTRTPETSDPEALRERFEQLDTSITADTSIVARAGTGGKQPAKTGMGPGRDGGGAKPKKEPPKRKVAPKKKKEDDKRKKPIELSLPEPPSEPRQDSGEGSGGAAASNNNIKDKKKKRRDPESEDEEDDDDDDDTLQVEYPGSEPRRGYNDFSPAFPQNNFTVRRFSEFAEKLRESGNEDFDDESRSDADDDAGLSGFKLPSPVGKQSGGHHTHTYEEQEEEDDDEAEADGEEEDEDEDEEIEMEDVNVNASGQPSQEQDFSADLEADLESHLNAEMDSSNSSVDLAAELENELMQENELRKANSGQDADSESEVSEED